jgi:hypothetical protein
MCKARVNVYASRAHRGKPIRAHGLLHCVVVEPVASSERPFVIGLEPTCVCVCVSMRPTECVRVFA